MTAYRYDGSFEGFLCAVTDCLEAGEGQPDFVWNGAVHVVGLFAGDIREVATVRESALAFRKRFVWDIELTSEPTLTDTEQDYAALWQRYFQRHAIAERHNPKLKQKHVPLRYRKHLLELESSNDSL